MLQLPQVVNSNVKIIEESDDITYFKGLNRQPRIEQGELAEMTNLASTFPGCIYPRPPRELIKTLAAGSNLFTANNGKLCYVDGANFYYDGILKGSLISAGSKSIAELGGIILIFPDKKYYDYINAVYGDIGTNSPADGEAPSTGQCPNMDMICVFNNRVWGIKNSTVYASKYNDPFTWAKYSVPAAEDDSVYFKISTERGKLTGLIPLENHIVFTTDASIYEMYGTKPSNYIPRLVAGNKGCIDGRSLAEIEGAIFMLAPDGVNVYAGSYPSLMSTQLNEGTYVSGVAGTDGRKYYISLYNGTAYSLYVYDTYIKQWHREDDLQVTDFVLFQKKLTALTADSKVYKFDSGVETVAWEAQTDKFTEQYMGMKSTSKLKLEADLEPGTTIGIYIKYNNDDYTLVKEFVSNGYQYFKCDIIPKRCEHFQVKITGTGAAKIFKMGRRIIVGSDIKAPTGLDAITTKKNWLFYLPYSWDQVAVNTWEEMK